MHTELIDYIIENIRVNWMKQKKGKKKIFVSHKKPYQLYTPFGKQFIYIYECG